MPTQTKFKSGMKAGDTGPPVYELQRFLANFGYAELPGKTPRASHDAANGKVPTLTPEVFDLATAEALKGFQSRWGLDATGEVDDGTAELMATPRCGVPDRIGDGEFRAEGRWLRTNLTFGFENFADDLTPDRCRSAIRSALDLWSVVSPLRFREVPIGQNPDLKIRFVRGGHGLEIFAPFDGAGGILAHAYPPESGEVHFDDDERWSVDVPPSGTDLATVACHEFGHALGLGHSAVRAAIMRPALLNGTVQRNLHQDDIEGIQFLYGRSPTSRSTLTPPVAVSNRDGRLEVFALSTEGRLVSWAQRAVNVWNADWGQIGSPRLEGRLAVAQNQDGRLEVFARGDNHELRHVWQETAGGRWASFGNLGGSWTSDPAAARNADGRLEVFIRGAESEAHHRNQIAPGSTWTPFYGSLGQSLSGPPVALRLPDGRLQLVVLASDSMLYTRWQETPGGGWAPWQRISNGVYSAPPAMFVDGGGLLHVMGRGTDGALWSNWSRGAGSPWSGPASHGGQLSQGAVPVAEINMAGGLELFARFADGTIHHRYQTPAPEYWSRWLPLMAAAASDPTVAKSADGRLEVFAHLNDVSLLHRWQQGDGSWA